MIKGLYTTASGMYPQWLEQEIVANNLANLNTTGFKKDSTYFKKVLDASLILNTVQGEENGLSDVQKVVTNFEQGTLEPTNNPLNLAIDGNGFFVIQTPEGEKFTRNGNFRLDPENRLINGDGNFVLGESGVITFTEGEININKDGEIYQNGVLIDKIRVVDFPQPYRLEKRGNSYFVPADPDSQTIEPDSYIIRQGYLENSNVNPIQEMIRMITITKNFQVGQKLIQIQDRTMQKIINETSKF